MRSWRRSSSFSRRGMKSLRRSGAVCRLRERADLPVVDQAEKGTGVAVASRLLHSRVRFVHENLYHLRPGVIGTFDIVLFLGLPLAGSARRPPVSPSCRTRVNVWI